MTAVDSPPELEARLAQRAAQHGVELDQLLKEGLTRYLHEEPRYGEAALRRGQFVTHEQVGDRLQRFL